MTGGYYLAVLLLSILKFSSSMLFGGSETDTIAFNKPSQHGFEQNPDVYSHLIIPPWSRPFKIGYCKSWEWSTDKTYREARLEICQEYSKGEWNCLEYCIYWTFKAREGSTCKFAARQELSTVLNVKSCREIRTKIASVGK